MKKYEEAYAYSIGYYLTYRNLGRPERTAVFKTKRAAENCRDFLKFQGATEVRAKRVKKDGTFIY